MSASTIGAAAGFALGGPIGAYLGFTAGVQKENLDEAKGARRAQEDLENQRRTDLANQAAAREAAAERAKTSGQRAGVRTSFMSGFGFGSGNTTKGIGKGTLFGN